MIEIIEQRLDGRFYGTPVRCFVEISTKIDVQPHEKGLDAELSEWKQRVEKVADSFAETPCEGKIEASVRRPHGYVTNGCLATFDSGTTERINPVILKLYAAISAELKSHRPFSAQVNIKVRVVSVFIQKEGATVPFAELDTETREIPTKFKVVNVPSPLAN